ncbi:hydrogenase maturation protease [Kribbella sp. NBC_00709]|uniref:hydrogenase maturation protease n=1 Tax=Kribbella sp. NBC_00709 TaxID=2975972 RepID=UPI002E2E3002|nr:hydrogenase maturation protease [Kribbella sp. NBC_00709]
MTVLVAGLGNIFSSDDGFGVAVVDQLSRRSLPADVEVRDFGIRGIHLAYQLLEPYDLVVLVDAVQRGGPPGTVYMIEAEPGDEPGEDVAMDAHDLGPDAVLSLVPRLGGTVGPVVVVGCEPAGIDPGIGLSPAVEDAVGTAVQMVIDLVTGQVAGPPVGVTEGES